VHNVRIRGKGLLRPLLELLVKLINRQDLVLLR
jgi:hypothetical protein